MAFSRMRYCSQLAPDWLYLKAGLKKLPYFQEFQENVGKMQKKISRDHESLF